MVRARMATPADHPRLRPVEITPLPASEHGERLWLLSDPAGYLEAPLELSGAALLLLALCDGSRDAAAICADYGKRGRAELAGDELAEFLARMDELLLLDSARFRARVAAETEEWSAREWRPAAHAGGAYPAAPDELRAALDGWLAEAPARPLPPGRLRALVAPHIDYHRGGAGYGRAYARLRDFEPPEVVVLLGTGHAVAGGRFVTTAKGFETPLGRLPLDRRFLDRLEQGLGRSCRAGELAHRREHSLELQAVWLAHLFPQAPPAIVPILTSSFDDLMAPGGGPLRDGETRDFLCALRGAFAAETRRALLLVGADFAHVGPRFGDQRPADAAFLAEVRQRDEAALAALVAGSAPSFFAAVAAHRNQDRICSVASLYTALFAADASHGEALVYDQAVDASGELAVTYAGAALYGDLGSGCGLAPRHRATAAPSPPPERSDS